MEDVPRIIDAALERLRRRGAALPRARATASRSIGQDDIPFFKKQTRTILGNNQKIDPIRILDYIEQGGYAALEKVLARTDPELDHRGGQEVGPPRPGRRRLPHRQEVGAGPEAPATDHGKKYIVCNADEGDPGAYMDRSLLEGNPHAIIEGMIIAGDRHRRHARASSTSAASIPWRSSTRMIALRQARDLGLLGENILGTGIDFDIDIVRGAGAFVCGEETALIQSIEGMHGRTAPAAAVSRSSRGIHGKPDLHQQRRDPGQHPGHHQPAAAEAYAKIGIPGNTGTKIFSLVGKIKNTGLVEVPLGITISEVVYDIGGGPVGKAKIKAVQTGGPPAAASRPACSTCPSTTTA